MAIEVKEMHIKVNIREDVKDGSQGGHLSTTDLAKLEQQLVETCVRKVLEKLKEKEER